MKIILLVLIFFFKNTVVFAHSPLNSIIPKNNEILSQAPKLIKIMLEKQKINKKDAMLSNFFSNQFTYNFLNIADE